MEHEPLLLGSNSQRKGIRSRDAIGPKRLCRERASDSRISPRTTFQRRFVGQENLSSSRSELVCAAADAIAAGRNGTLLRLEWKLQSLVSDDTRWRSGIRFQRRVSRSNRNVDLNRPQQPLKQHPSQLVEEHPPQCASFSSAAREPGRDKTFR